MVLFHHIIEIFHLADDNRRAVLGVIALDGGFIGRTPVNGDLVGYAVAADRLREEALGGLLIPLLRQQKVNRLAVFIDGAIEIAPLASG